MKSQISTLTERSFMNTLSDQISGNGGRQERRFLRKTRWKLIYFYTKKTWKWVFLLGHNVICRQTEMKIEGKELSNSWNLSFLTFSHINLHRSTKPQTKIKSTVSLYLTVNTEIINKLYMKRCEENIQNQTISDTQRESSHIVLVKLLLNSP